MSEHPITKRFRAWLSSVADQLGCGVIDPGNLKHRCEFSFGHDGKHDFEKDSLPQIRIRVRDQPISKADRVGSWTKLNGTWCVQSLEDSSRETSCAFGTKMARSCLWCSASTSARTPSRSLEESTTTRNGSS